MAAVNSPYRIPQLQQESTLRVWSTSRNSTLPPQHSAAQIHKPASQPYTVSYSPQKSLNPLQVTKETQPPAVHTQLQQILCRTQHAAGKYLAESNHHPLAGLDQGYNGLQASGPWLQASYQHTSDDDDLCKRQPLKTDLTGSACAKSPDPGTCGVQCFQRP